MFRASLWNARMPFICSFNSRSRYLKSLSTGLGRMLGVSSPNFDMLVSLVDGVHLHLITSFYAMWESYLTIHVPTDSSKLLTPKNDRGSTVEFVLPCRTWGSVTLWSSSMSLTYTQVNDKRPHEERASGRLAYPF